MGKGGARYGAGRPAYKVKGEQLQRLDVRELARKGLLKGTRTFTWSWNRGGEPTGSIAVWVANDALTLRYTTTINGDRSDMAVPVALRFAACNFGGTRPWFECPRCSKRVAVLYLRSGRFACRHCQRVAYSSQSEDTMARMWRKQGKIEARLDDDGKRPKGMRLRTYERLRDTMWQCEQIRDEATFSAITRLFGHRLKGRFPL